MSFKEAASSIIKDALDVLEIAVAKYKNCDCNHIMITFFPQCSVTVEDVEYQIHKVYKAHPRLFKLRVLQGELKISINENGRKIPLRFYIENFSGYFSQVQAYRQRNYSLQPLKGGPEKKIDLHPVKAPLQPRRHRAHLMGTTYVYDFPALFNEALQCEGGKMECEELIMIKSDVGREVRPVQREIGLNKIGIVGWLMKLFTKEYPNGREIVVIANDITFQIGSFGVEEDLMFDLCSKYARLKGIPRIYLCANSGARIGLAEEILPKYKVSWKDPLDLTKGYDYLYLEKEDDCLKGSVKAEKIVVKGEVRYKITDIIGLKDGLGVENLKGSGLIASETCMAYKDIFTITLVTCRSVGIGAYLVRLGQRTIQVEGHPIILTGYHALNKVLGRDIYSSNLQIVRFEFNCREVLRLCMRMESVIW